MPAITRKLTSLISEALQRHPAEGQLWLGFSGGLDSTVLLHLLDKAGISFQALHIHHGLSAEADQWQSHCAQQAQWLGVPFQTRNVQVDAGSGGVEQGARIARYHAFEQVMAPGDQILLAHHGDDQAETFLLRLLRGAGALGLAAMEQWRTLGQNKSLLRPLLGVTRQELEAYAHAQSIDWVEDGSNTDIALDRNYLRSQVVPSLAARWPFVDRVAQAVGNLRETAQLLSELAVEDSQGAGLRAERFGESIGLAAFHALSLARQKNLLRSWAGTCGGQAPEASQLAQALEQTRAAEDAQPQVALGELVLRRYRDRLYLTPQLQPLNHIENGGGRWQWDGIGELQLPGGWVLSPSESWSRASYVVRFRSGGERAKPAARNHSQTLKKLLQEYALEPWLRGYVPLIYRDEALLAVGDLFATAEGPPELPIWRFLD